MDDKTKAFIEVLQLQRNQALDEVARLVAELSAVQKQLNEKPAGEDQ